MRSRSRFLTPGCLLVLLLAACATTHVAPLTAARNSYLADEDERVLVAQADDFERELRARGLMVEDAALQRYVNEVGNKLVPPTTAERVHFHFAVLRDPTVNAFSLAQGGIFVHAGLLARLENEAQLAHVLGHEITHTVRRDQLTFVRSLQNKTVAAKVADIVLAPAAGVIASNSGANLISTIVGLTYAAAVTGYGREHEEEADEEGLKLMAAAGYQPREAVRLFTVLNEDAEPGALETFFYSDHPANRTRQDYTRRLIDSGAITASAHPIVNADVYLRVTRTIALENIKLRLGRSQYQCALDEVSAFRTRRGDDPWLHYYAGEAHRGMATHPEDAAREQALRKRERLDEALIDSFKARAAAERGAAVAQYRQALVSDPALSRAHRGLGLIAYGEGDTATARRELRLYLDGKNAVPDRRYIEHLLAELPR